MATTRRRPASPRPRPTSRRPPGGRRPRRAPPRRTRSAPPLLTVAQRRELGGLGLLAVGLVLLLSLALPHAPVTAALARVAFGLLGLAAWGLAVVVIGVASRVLGWHRRGRGAAGAIGLVAATGAAAGLLGLVHGSPGGFVGAHLGPPLAARTGGPVGVVVLAAVGLAGLVLALDLSPSRWGPAAVGAGRWMGGAFRAAPSDDGRLRARARSSLAAGPRARGLPPPPSLVPPASLPAVAPVAVAKGIAGEAEVGVLSRFERVFEGLERLDDGEVVGSAVAPAITASGVPPPPGIPLSLTAALVTVPASAPAPGEQPVGGPAGDPASPAVEGAGPGAIPLAEEEVEPDWHLPSQDLLDTVTGKRERLREEIRSRIQTIEATLEAFQVDARVVGVNAGPTVTQYELQPGPGVAVRKVVTYQTDLALALAAPIRIQAPIPGKSAIGIEVPNKAAQLVTLKEVVRSPAFSSVASGLAIALGADVSGHAVIGDLARMPHLLIAGATGSGKSVCINAVLAGLLLQGTPRDLRLILVDPKRVELSNFADLPHLLVPVVVEPDAAVAALRWAVTEMEQRYKLFAGHGARNIAIFNERAPELGLQPLPRVVIVIDELADLMMVAANEIEELICRVAQLARAVGIHLIVATQRPSADIITGLIKANIPSRVAFAVSSGVDSRVILDEMGAEKLLGRGDMLYLPIDAGKATRLQGAFVSDRELDQLIGWWKAQGAPRYQEEILEMTQLSPQQRDGVVQRDPLFGRAARVVATEGRAAASLLQRKLNVGYTRAARLVDQLAEARVVGPYEGSKSREVLMSLPDVDELLAGLSEER
ncbi:MAG TPA: DNA translocase FtsK [Verrucomicrobiae bacterium]|nr:DNA translocase FtsK [Verrucomicrobiae bacterium]